MKIARIVLLLLLAVLLPARGVMAATMNCLPLATGDVAAHTLQHVQSEHAGHVEHVANEAHGCAEHSSAHANGEHASHQAHGDHATSHHAGGTCGACAACCSAPALAAPWPAVVAPALLGDMRFIDVGALAPEFESDGLERPPRSA